MGGQYVEVLHECLGIFLSQSEEIIYFTLMQHILDIYLAWGCYHPWESASRYPVIPWWLNYTVFFDIREPAVGSVSNNCVIHPNAAAVFKPLERGVMGVYYLQYQIISIVTPTHRGITTILHPRWGWIGLHFSRLIVWSADKIQAGYLCLISSPRQYPGTWNIVDSFLAVPFCAQLLGTQSWSNQSAPPIQSCLSTCWYNTSLISF